VDEQVDERHCLSVSESGGWNHTPESPESPNEITQYLIYVAVVRSTNLPFTFNVDSYLLTYYSFIMRV